MFSKTAIFSTLLTTLLAKDDLPCRRHTTPKTLQTPDDRTNFTPRGPKTISNFTESNTDGVAAVFKNAIREKAIGCCPNGDPNGKPFGPGKACCCDKVYHTDTAFCCMPHGCDGSQEVLDITPENISLCESFKSCPKEPVSGKKGEKFECGGTEEGNKCSLECKEGYNYKGDVNNTELYTCSKGSWLTINAPARETSCCLPVCPPVPEDTVSDIFIVLDKSSSIGADNFEFVRDFVKQILAQLPLGSDLVQVSLTTYNKVVEQVFTLGESSDLSLLNAAVDAIEYKGKGTYTGAGLMDVVANGMTNPNNRAHARDMVLLVTDGRSKDYSVVEEAVQVLHPVSEIYVIGVGSKIKESELFYVASEPVEEHFNTVPDYAELVNQVQWVLQSQCPTSCPGN